MQVRCAATRRPVGIFALLFSMLAVLASFGAAAQNHVYVTSTGAVAAINPLTNTVAKTIPVGAAPVRVVVNKTGTRAYVANSGSNSISVIDTAANAVIHTYALAGSPSSVAVSPNGLTLYVSVPNAVQVLNAATGALIASVPVSGASALAVTPNGARVYVAAGNIVVIDTATNTALKSISPGLEVGAHAIAISPNGQRAYVAANGMFSGDLVVLNLLTDTVYKTVLMGSLLGEVAVSPDSARVYVGIAATWVDTGYGAGFFPGRVVSVVDTKSYGGAYIDLGSSGSNWSQQNTAAGIAVAGDRSNVYIAVPRTASVAVANLNTNVVTATVPVTNPRALATKTSAPPFVPYVIDAVNDSGTISVAGGTVIASVLANDRLGGLPVTTSHVRVSLVSSAHPAVTLSGSAVKVAAATPAGVYALVYKICEIASTANCDTATATVTVRERYVIDAVNDAATTNPGLYAVSNVLSNDTLAGTPASTARVSVSLVSSSNPGITLSGVTVVVASNVAPGAYTLNYRICEIADPTNCDIATVALTVVARPIDAVDDSASAPRTGGVVLANVLANDKFAGVAATLTRVNLALVSASSSLTLNAATGAVSLAPGAAVGLHTLQYRICEIVAPTNCDSATVSVTVQSYAIDAVNDAGRASSKTAGTAVASVLANDWFAGARATTANVKLSVVSVTPANPMIKLDLTDGSVDILGKSEASGTYSMVYQICEIASPTNCDRATVTIDLSGGI